MVVRTSTTEMTLALQRGVSGLAIGNARAQSDQFVQSSEPVSQLCRVRKVDRGAWGRRSARMPMRCWAMVTIALWLMVTGLQFWRVICTSECVNLQHKREAEVNAIEAR